MIQSQYRTFDKGHYSFCPWGSQSCRTMAWISTYFPSNWNGNVGDVGLSFYASFTVSEYLLLKVLELLIQPSTKLTDYESATCTWREDRSQDNISLAHSMIDWSSQPVTIHSDFFSAHSLIFFYYKTPLVSLPQPHFILCTQQSSFFFFST